MYYIKKAKQAIRPGKFKVGEFGKVLMRFASSQLLSNVLRMIAGFVVVRMVAPETYGRFAGVGVFLGYILLGHGGILNGISRELPYEIGKGNKEYAIQLANSANFITFIIGIIASTLFFLFGIYYFYTGDNITGTIFLSYSLPAFLYLYNKQFLPSLYRTNKDFDSLSKQNILTGIGNLLSVIFVYLWGLWGLCIRQVFIFVYETVLLHRKKPYKVNLTYQKDDLKKLLATGFPIFIAGNINPLVSTVMNNVLFSLGGALNYGYYALTNIVSSAIGIIPNSFSQVIYPRMAIMYGEGKTVRYILRVNVKPLIFQFFVLFVMGVVGAILLPWLVPIFLPKYSPGIAAAQWMMFVPATQAFGSMLNIFSVMKKMRPYVIANVTGGIASILFAVIVIYYFGFDLVIFPQAIMIGKIIQQLISFGQLYSILKSEQNGKVFNS